MPLDSIQQRGGRDRLGDVAVHAGGEAGLVVAAHGVGGDRHDRHAGKPRVGRAPDPPRRLQPVHHRHLHVHEHEIVRFGLKRLERLLAVADHVDPVPRPAQDDRGEATVDRVVVGQQKTERWRALPPQVKLAGQITAACVLMIGGIHIELGRPAPLAAVELAITLLWLIGITNAFNLLDNMDGLSAGIASIAGLMLFAHNAMQGHVPLAILWLVVAGAAAGFLIHNFYPATIFMGDCGSMTFGFALAGLALMGARGVASDLFLALLVPIAILGLPIFDTSLVTIVRRIHGRPVTLGGRDHLSHRLVALGLSERGAVLVLYAISAGLGALGLVALYLGFWSALATGALAVVAIVLFGVFLGQVRVYGEPAEPAVAVTSIAWQRDGRSDTGLGPDLAAMALDVVLIAGEDVGLLEVRIQIGFGIEQRDADREVGHAHRRSIEMVHDAVARDGAAGAQAKDHAGLNLIFDGAQSAERVPGHIADRVGASAVQSDVAVMIHEVVRDDHVGRTVEPAGHVHSGGAARRTADLGDVRAVYQS